MSLSDHRQEALDQVEILRSSALGTGAEVAPDVFAPLQDADRIDWIGAVVMAAAFAYPYTVELRGPTGEAVLYAFTDATDLQARAGVCLARYQAIQAAALQARIAIRAATDDAQIDAAIATLEGAL